MKTCTTEFLSVYAQCIGNRRTDLRAVCDYAHKRREIIKLYAMRHLCQCLCARLAQLNLLQDRSEFLRERVFHLQSREITHRRAELQPRAHRTSDEVDRKRQGARQFVLPPLHVFLQCHGRIDPSHKHEKQQNGNTPDKPHLGKQHQQHASKSRTQHGRTQQAEHLHRENALWCERQATRTNQTLVFRRTNRHDTGKRSP